MSVLQRINQVAAALAGFPEMGAFADPEALRELIDSEWSEGAIPPRRILHVISANTAMAGMQSLVRGLLLGSENWCKIPGAGLPRFEEFVRALAPELRERVEISATLPEAWLAEADAVIVFGSDETVEMFREKMREDQIFAGYGNRWSGAVILSDPDFSSIEGVTRDMALYDQMGCLSAQIVWLHDSIDAVEYGTRLASALTAFPNEDAVPDLASVARWRSSAEWQTAIEPGNRIWFSPGEPVWGVWLQGQNQPTVLSCLHRHVTLRRFSTGPDLGSRVESVSTLGYWPDVPEVGRVPGPSRFCRVGEMQFPPPTWQQDGCPALGRLLSKWDVS